MHVELFVVKIKVDKEFENDEQIAYVVFVDKTLIDNAIISRGHVSVHRYYKTDPLLVLN